ncbi:MAG: potassium transporter TrkH [Candidatus Delongbacteria bacterium]|nr:potassium transporter TrkH [Candidatus Delongbacteria bacterium]
MKLLKQNKFIENIRLQPIQLLLLGYLIVVVTGTLFLTMPFCQTGSISLLDNLFTSTSAVSTTGLVTKSIADEYTFIGRLAILIMIQIGGIGYMSIASFVVLGQGKKLTNSGNEMLQSDFSLPNDFHIESFIKNVVIFSIIIETTGTLTLLPSFIHMGFWNGLWHSLFHSVSAFCTAGFGLFNNSFENYRDNFSLNLVISILSYLGAIGFIVFTDIWEFLRGRKERITYTTEIILKFTLFLSVFGTVLIFLTEPSVVDLPAEKRLLSSFFQSMTAMTTVGFNTVPIGSLSSSAIFLVILLMIVGASPSGTGGGIKSTTVTAVYAQMSNVLKGSTKVIFNGRIIPNHRLITASANFTFYIIFLWTGIYILLLTEQFPFYQVFFEATSALGTVGLSTGITGMLSPLGKITLIFLMFAGRVGPLSVGTALFSKRNKVIEEDDLVI